MKCCDGRFIPYFNGDFAEKNLPILFANRMFWSSHPPQSRNGPFGPSRWPRQSDCLWSKFWSICDLHFDCGSWSKRSFPTSHLAIRRSEKCFGICCKTAVVVVGAWLCFFVFILAQSKSIFTNVHRVDFLEGPCFGGPPNRGALNATIKTCIARQLESLENVRKQDTEHWRTTLDFTHFRLVIQLINTSQASSYCVPQREHFIQWSDEMIATIRWPNTEIHPMIILSS